MGGAAAARGLFPLILLALSALAACSGDRQLSCSSGSMYREARAAGPLSIPGDLSAPDESESLRIPDTLPPIDRAEEDPERCLEASPGLVRND